MLIPTKQKTPNKPKNKNKTKQQEQKLKPTWLLFTLKH